MLAIGRSKSVWLFGRPVSEADGNRDAVIALQPRDDLLLLRPAERIVIVPDELDLRVVGVRARGAEEHLRTGIGAISFSFSASSIAGSWLCRRTDA